MPPSEQTMPSVAWVPRRCRRKCDTKPTFSSCACRQPPKPRSSNTLANFRARALSLNVSARNPMAHCTATESVCGPTNDPWLSAGVCCGDSIDLVEILAGPHGGAGSGDGKLDGDLVSWRRRSGGPCSSVRRRPADAAVHDVAGKRGVSVEGGLDGVHDRPNGARRRGADLFGMEHDGFRHAAHQVAAADLGLSLLGGEPSRSRADLFGRLAADKQFVLPLT